jgi:tRNA threonylcarbamoyladenosine biosynthesis protein TsaB
MILCIETATSICSVALCNRDGVVSIRESSEGKSHASLLTVFTIELLKEAGIGASDLEAVAVSKGPGSYTGLRIGVSAAKGIAYGAGIPLISVCTLLSIYKGFRALSPGRDEFMHSDIFCPSLDARRMEIYYSLYDYSGNQVKDIAAEVINEGSFSDLPSESRLFIFGEGAEKCRSVVKRENTFFDSTFRVSSSFMSAPAYKALDNKNYEDIAYFEPFYLKDFLATKPVKNILGI